MTRAESATVIAKERNLKPVTNIDLVGILEPVSSEIIENFENTGSITTPEPNTQNTPDDNGNSNPTDVTHDPSSIPIYIDDPIPEQPYKEPDVEPSLEELLGDVTISSGLKINSIKPLKSGSKTDLNVSESSTITATFNGAPGPDEKITVTYMATNKASDVDKRLGQEKEISGIVVSGKTLKIPAKNIFSIIAEEELIYTYRKLYITVTFRGNDYLLGEYNLTSSAFIKPITISEMLYEAFNTNSSSYSAPTTLDKYPYNGLIGASLNNKTEETLTRKLESTEKITLTYSLNGVTNPLKCSVSGTKLTIDDNEILKLCDGEKTKDGIIDIAITKGKFTAAIGKIQVTIFAPKVDPLCIVKASSLKSGTEDNLQVTEKTIVNFTLNRETIPGESLEASYMATNDATIARFDHGNETLISSASVSQKTFKVPFKDVFALISKETSLYSTRILYVRAVKGDEKTIIGKYYINSTSIIDKISVDSCECSYEVNGRNVSGQSQRGNLIGGSNYFDNGVLSFINGSTGTIKLSRNLTTNESIVLKYTEDGKTSTISSSIKNNVITIKAANILKYMKDSGVLYVAIKKGNYSVTIGEIKVNLFTMPEEETASSASNVRIIATKSIENHPYQYLKTNAIVEPRSTGYTTFIDYFAEPALYDINVRTHNLEAHTNGTLKLTASYTYNWMENGVMQSKTYTKTADYSNSVSKMFYDVDKSNIYPAEKAEVYALYSDGQGYGNKINLFGMKGPGPSVIDTYANNTTVATSMSGGSNKMPDGSHVKWLDEAIQTLKVKVDTALNKAIGVNGSCKYIFGDLRVETTNCNFREPGLGMHHYTTKAGSPKSLGKGDYYLTTGGFSYITFTGLETIKTK